MTKDEAVIAHMAATKLIQLYHAYRAMNRANGLIIGRLNKQLAGDDDVRSAAKLIAQQELVQRKAAAHAADLSFRMRIEQLGPRVQALKAWRP